MLQAKTSPQDDTTSPAEGSTALSVNKVSRANDFAETLGRAQVNNLASDELGPMPKEIAQKEMDPHSEVVVSEAPVVGLSVEVLGQKTPASIGNRLPEKGKTVPAELPAQMFDGISQTQADAEITMHAGAQLESRLAPVVQQPIVQPAPEGRAGVLPEAVARINESLQMQAKSIDSAIVDSSTVLKNKQSVTGPIEGLPEANNSTLMRSARYLERAGLMSDNAKSQSSLGENVRFPTSSISKAVATDVLQGESPKSTEGSKTSHLNSVLAAGKPEGPLADLHTASVKTPSTESKTELLNAGLSETKVGAGKAELDQRIPGTVKTPLEAGVAKGANEQLTLARNELSGDWMQKGDSKLANVERAGADAMPARIEPPLLNNASLMQRQIEQRVAKQGGDTKRLQAEVAAALETRVSAESVDRPLSAQAKVEATANILPKQVSTPTAGNSDLTSRQADAAVQDQILRVMSRQALAQGRLTLQLNPHELGSLDIEFSTEKGEVQVAIVARESSTRDLLEASVARLRANLQDVGVNVGQLDIRQGDRQSDEQGTKESNHQSLELDASVLNSDSEEIIPQLRPEEGGIHIYV